MKKMLLILLLNLFIIQASAQQFPKPEKHPEYQEYFLQYGLKGSFAFYKLNENIYGCYDCYMADSATLPASTFKILNTLIALETGVAADENFALKWDLMKRNYDPWNKDQTMKEAFANSTVWFYQEVARRIGEKRMKEWVRKAGYGNMNINGGIDLFWLSGDLKITPKQQLDFLKKLYMGTLPFSKRSMEITKKIMLREETPTYKIYAKTGRADTDKYNMGWYVGWVEQGGNVYFFATRIFDADKNNEDFNNARIEITKAILTNHFGLLK